MRLAGTAFVIGALAVGTAFAALPNGSRAPNFTAEASLGGKTFTFSLARALKKGPVVLTVTPKGRKLYSTVIPLAQRNQARLLHILSRNERRALYVILNKLFAAIGDRDAFI